MHYYTFHPKDYMSKTNFLEPMEDLAYRRMLDYQYLNECPLPKDIDEIAMLINMRTHSESIATVLRYFFELADDGYVNDRAEKEIAKYQTKSDKARESANVRWRGTGSKASSSKASSDSNSNAMRMHSEGNANHKPSTTNQEPLTSLPFDDFWNAYDYKKGGLVKPKAKWLSLSIETQKLIMAHVPDYVKSTPNKSYRKYPMTYLNNEGWLDEITDLDNTDAEQSSSARPHSNRSDSFDSQPQTKSLSREEQIAANKANMAKAGLEV
ncbi:YdaU family protein [uncultured Psychrobacter sp.]|uniref:YdaU family protein n=1 Tax=uncultured Psychrobacter sp. TaxID=259303 RepID=UPI002633D8BB|nr:YdaU family protein [uncultured Psychrobacter sp.]